MLRSSRDAVKLLSSCRVDRLAQSTRLFSASASAGDSGLDASSKPTVTKKKYTELPTVRVLPDGTRLTPLAPWSAGEDTKGTRHGYLDRYETQPLPTELETSVALGLPLGESDDFSPQVKTRKRRVAKGAAVNYRSPIASEEVDDTLKETFIDEDASIAPGKPKRRRKAKVDALEHATPRQPRNQLATEILENLTKFPHCILLTRVGQFYESYFDQAGEVARLLNIKLTSRTWDGHRILMCGFPYMHLQKSLKTLVQQNARFVALCEEFPQSSAPGVKPTFDRRVVRVITPGTLIDEPFLNQYENNYLLSVGSTNVPEDLEASSATPVGLAWIDVSTGEFFTKDSSYENLRDDIVRIGPREIVLSKELADRPNHPIRMAILEEDTVSSYISPSTTSHTIQLTDSVARASSSDNVTSVGEDVPIKRLVFSDHETAAIDLLTTYLHANLLEHMPRLSLPSREGAEKRMQIDSHTIRALEIKEGMREGGVTGSLLSVVKRTVTNSGTRLLARWLCSPSTSLSEVNARQSLVAFFYARPHLRDDLVEHLQRIDDATRIVQKFLVGRGDASDLSAISSTISIWSSIKNRIELERTMEEREKGTIVPEDWASLDALTSRMDDLAGLSKRITLALEGIKVDEDGDPMSTGSEEETASLVPDIAPSSESKPQTEYNWTINPNFSAELVALHSELDGFLRQREQLERRLQRDYDAPSLSLRSSPMQGFHVHVARARRDAGKVKASPEFTVVSESNSTSGFFHRGWASLGRRIMETNNDIGAAEKKAFEMLRGEVNAHEDLLRRNARIVDELDVTLGFANLAAEMRFTRPTVKEDQSLHVVNGRHPTVELGLLSSGRVFTPNTVTFSPDSRLHIITGPNMAGKSTLLRQTALIALLAQTGSFVPADHATVGLVDRLFSRVGAKDDLFRDRSTFMVEMLETAEILQRATPNSLVIMDEVGRGTTVKDGLAIAFATVHHLYAMNQSRVLFATHFHELTDMLGNSPDHKGEGAFQNIGFFCTDVDETEDGHFAYSHRLRPGVNRDSHGLKVAQLAGMPTSAVAVARDALSWLKNNGSANSNSADLKALGQSLVSAASATPI